MGIHYLRLCLLFVVILLFVLAVGVVWEVAEFALDYFAGALDMEAALAQHGIDDTIGDLLCNVAGAIVAATVGLAYLQRASHNLANRLGEERSGG